MKSSNICVGIRVKPTNDREKIWIIGDDNKTITKKGENEKNRCYSHVFDQNTDSKTIYDEMVKPLIFNLLEGINATVFAYGQTGSGKTYTMSGTNEHPGVINYSILEIFNEKEKNPNKISVEFSYFEIYNEKFRDLLVDNAELEKSERYTVLEEDSAEGVFSHISIGNKRRSIGATNMNDRSSRSHAIAKFTISVAIDTYETLKSTLFLVDLAGSECVADTGATGNRQNEAKNINKSLLSLSKVIEGIVHNQPVSYNDSKLTKLLKKSLGGEAKTAIICTISSDSKQKNVSENTLRFASTAMKVKSKPKVNKIISDKDLIKQLQAEIITLQGKINIYKNSIPSDKAKDIEISRSRIEEITSTLISNKKRSYSRISERKSLTPIPKNSLIYSDSEYSDVDAECDKLVTEVLGKDHKNLINITEIENEQLKSQLEDANKELQKIKTELEDSNKKLQENKNENDKLINYAKSYEKTVEEMKLKIIECEEEIKTLKKEKDNSNELLTKLNNDNDKTNTQINCYKEEIELKEKEIKELKEECNSLKNEQKELNDQLKESDTKKEKLIRMNDLTKEENRNYFKTLTELQMENKRLKLVSNSISKADIETQIILHDNNINKKVFPQYINTDEFNLPKMTSPDSKYYLYHYISLFLTFIIALVIIII